MTAVMWPLSMSMLFAMRGDSSRSAIASVLHETPVDDGVKGGGYRVREELKMRRARRFYLELVLTKQSLDLLNTSRGRFLLPLARYDGKKHERRRNLIRRR